MFLTETAKLADVVLPLVSAAETCGTVIASDGSVQQYKSALPSRTGKRNWKTLVELAQAMGVKAEYASLAEVTEAARAYQPCCPTETPEQKIMAERYADSMELWFKANNPR